MNKAFEATKCLRAASGQKDGSLLGLETSTQAPTCPKSCEQMHVENGTCPTVRSSLAVTAVTYFGTVRTMLTSLSHDTDMP